MLIRDKMIENQKLTDQTLSHASFLEKLRQKTVMNRLIAVVPDLINWMQGQLKGQGCDSTLAYSQALSNFAAMGTDQPFYYYDINSLPERGRNIVKGAIKTEIQKMFTADDEITVSDTIKIFIKQ